MNYGQSSVDEYISYIAWKFKLSLCAVEKASSGKCKHCLNSMSPDPASHFVPYSSLLLNNANSLLLVNLFLTAREISAKTGERNDCQSCQTTIEPVQLFGQSISVQAKDAGYSSHCVDGAFVYVSNLCAMGSVLLTHLFFLHSKWPNKAKVKGSASKNKR